MLLANDGMRDGVQILPKSYLIEATDWKKHPSIFHPSKASPVFGYGYHFWLFPGESRRFAMVGIRGQVLYVDTRSKLVLVQTAMARHPDFYARDSMGMELGGVWRSLLDS
jgi:CubicO group peptidase (beta-lactamase class C family)